MKRIAAALTLVLVLAGCAVTGQPANPDVAATYDGVTVTNDQVAEWVEAFNDLGVSADAGAVLTFLLMKPTIDASATAAGILYSDDDLTFEARKWMASQQSELIPVTPAMLDAVREVRSLDALFKGQDTATELANVLPLLESDAIVSPMYGHFSANTYVESLKDAYTRQQSESNLGDVSYLVLKDVSGFDPVAQQPWMVNEAATSPPAPAAASATDQAPVPAP